MVDSDTALPSDPGWPRAGCCLWGRARSERQAARLDCPDHLARAGCAGARIDSGRGRACHHDRRDSRTDCVEDGRAAHPQYDRRHLRRSRCGQCSQARRRRQPRSPRRASGAHRQHRGTAPRQHPRQSRKAVGGQQGHRRGDDRCCLRRGFPSPHGLAASHRRRSGVAGVRMHPRDPVVGHHDGPLGGVRKGSEHRGHQRVWALCCTRQVRRRGARRARASDDRTTWFAFASARGCGPCSSCERRATLW